MFLKQKAEWVIKDQYSGEQKSKNGAGNGRKHIFYKMVSVGLMGRMACEYRHQDCKIGKSKTERGEPQRHLMQRVLGSQESLPFILSLSVRVKVILV